MPSLPPRCNGGPLNDERWAKREVAEVTIRAGGLHARRRSLLLGLIGLALLRSRVTDLGGQAVFDARVAQMRQILDYWDDPALRWDADWQYRRAAQGSAQMARRVYDDSLDARR